MKRLSYATKLWARNALLNQGSQPRGCLRFLSEKREFRPSSTSSYPSSAGSPSNTSVVRSGSKTREKKRRYPASNFTRKNIKYTGNVPDPYIPRTQKIPEDEEFIYLESLDKIVDRVKPNWSVIYRLLDSDIRRGDFESALRLTNRVVHSGLTPTSDFISIVIVLLSKINPLASCHVLLTLLSYAIEHKMTIKDTSIIEMSWAFRSCKSPFEREAFERLLEAYDNYAKNDDRLLLAEQTIADRIQSHLKRADLEQAIDEYRDAKKRYEKEDKADLVGDLMQKIPLNNMLNFVTVRRFDSSMALEILQDMQRHSILVNSNGWIALLNGALQEKDWRCVQYFWTYAVETGIIQPSNAALLDMFRLSCTNYKNHGNLDLIMQILRKIAFQGCDSDLSPSDAYHILQTITANGSLEDVFAGVALVFQHWGSRLRSNDFDPVHVFLASYNAEPDSMVEAVGEYASRTGAPEALKTLLMNCTIIGYTRYWAATSGLHVYRKFMQYGPVHFSPDIITFESLAYAAIMLKYCKKLGNAIYRESLLYKVSPSSRLFEILIRTGLRGSSFDTVYYYLAEMYRNDIPLKNYTAQYLNYSFSIIKDEDRLARVLRNPAANLREFSEFPSDRTLRDAVSTQDNTKYFMYSYFRDNRNTLNFMNGWPSDMLMKKR